MKGERHAQSGFTLLELLVAIALAALLATALAGFVRMAGATWDRTAAHTASSESLVRLDRTLRRQVAALVQAGTLSAISGQPPLFFGSHDGFGWVARTPAAAKQPGFYAQRVRVVADRGLILESWPVDRPDAVEAALLVAAEDIDFAYFGQRGAGQLPRWHRRWAAGPIPPQLIRISFPAQSRLPPISLAVP